MIQGKIKRNLSISSILSQITEWDIYRYYIGEDFTVGKSLSSPLREGDEDPSFRVDNLSNGLHHIDYAKPELRGDAIDFVRQKFSLSLQEAMEKIDEDFGLGLVPGKQYNIRKAPVYKQPKLEEKKVSFIQFEGTKKYNRIEQMYWNGYRASFDLLKRENVYGVRSLYIDRQRVNLPTDEPVFAYYAPEIEKVKIYRPFANKKKGQWKWKSNIPFTYMFGLNKLRSCDKVIIAKSQKDRIVLMSFTDDVVAVQGESFAAISDESFQKIKSKSNSQYLLFGSDPQGKEQAAIITSTLGIDDISMPAHYLPANDPAEVAKEYGLEAVFKHLCQKGILQLQKTG